jgi:hypothetical protein
MDYVWWGILLLIVLVAGVFVYVFVLKDIFEYRKAKAEIFPYVESYKKKCVGVNRFVVTVPELQNIFREYETKIINRVWLDLIREHVIEKDPMDDEWCVRKHGG